MISPSSADTGGQIMLINLIFTFVLAAGATTEAPAGPKVIKDTVTESLTSPYTIILPQDFDSTRKYPLVVLMHGLGGDVTQFTSQLPLFNTTDYIYLIAQAPFPYMIDDETIGYAWIYSSDEALTMRTLETSLRYLQAAVDKTLAAYPIAQGEIYAFGFSQGAAMCYTLMAHPASQPMTGIVPAGGFLIDSVEAELPKLNPTPILMLHGRNDKVIEYKWAEETKKKLEAAKFPVTMNAYPVDHTLIPEMFDDLDDFIAKRWLADPQSGNTTFMQKALAGDEMSLAMIMSGSRSGDPGTRLKVIRALGFLPAAPAEVEMNIRKGFERNASTEEMIALCRASAATRIPQTLEQLTKLANDKGKPEELRIAAWRAMRRFNTPEGEAALQKVPTVCKLYWVDADKQGGKLGMRAGDIITSADGKPVHNPDDLRNILNETSGKQIVIEALRGKETLKFNATGGFLGVRLVESPA